MDLESRVAALEIDLAGFHTSNNSQHHDMRVEYRGWAEHAVHAHEKLNTAKEMMHLILTDVREIKETHGKKLDYLTATVSAHTEKLDTLSIRVDDISTRVDDLSTTVDGHTVILGEHTRILGEHTQVLGEHTQVLGEHTRILGEHTQVLGEHTQVLGEHTVILGEHTQKLDYLSGTVDTHTTLLREILAKVS